MIVIICAKHKKNPSRTVNVTERTRFSKSRPNDLEDIGQGQRSLCATLSHGSDHLWLIWKESIQNCRCYRADKAAGTDGRTDGQTDRRTDGRSETNIPPNNFVVRRVWYNKLYTSSIRRNSYTPEIYQALEIMSWNTKVGMKVIKTSGMLVPSNGGTFGHWGNFVLYKTFVLSNIFCHLKNNLAVNMEVKGYLQSSFVWKRVSYIWTQ